MTTDYEYAAEAGKSQTTIKKEAEDKRIREERRRNRIRAQIRIARRGLKFVPIFVFLAIFCFVFRDRMFRTVGSGEVMVIYYRFFGGTDNKIAKEGLHILMPWDDGFIYKTLTQSLLVPMTVLTKNGVEVQVEAEMRFHPVPETVPYLHREYGPDYVKDIIIPELTESIQDVIGQFNPEELYSSQRGASASRIFQKAKRTIGGVFVAVDDIALFNIKLPEPVQDAINRKAEAEQGVGAAQFRVQQEAFEKQRKYIEAQSLAQYIATVGKIDSSLLVWKGIEATLDLAKSPNSKVIVMGSKDSLPLVLGNVPDIK